MNLATALFQLSDSRLVRLFGAISKLSLARNSVIARKFGKLVALKLLAVLDHGRRFVAVTGSDLSNHPHKTEPGPSVARMSHPDTDFITAPRAPIGKQSLVNRKGSIESAEGCNEHDIRPTLRDWSVGSFLNGHLILFLRVDFGS